MDAPGFVLVGEHPAATPLPLPRGWRGLGMFPNLPSAPAGLLHSPRWVFQPHASAPLFPSPFPLVNSFLKSSLDGPQNLVLPWLWTCSSPPCLLQLMRGFWGRDCPSAPRETAPCSPLAFGERRADGYVNNLSHLVVIPIKANCN